MFEVEVILLIKYDTWSYLSMCHENKMGAAKEQHPYIICRLDKQKWWNSSGTVTRPLFNTWCEEASRKSDALSPSYFL